MKNFVSVDKGQLPDKPEFEPNGSVSRQELLYCFFIKNPDLHRGIGMTAFSGIDLCIW